MAVSVGRYTEQSRAAKDAHNRDEGAMMDSGQNKEKPNQK